METVKYLSDNYVERYMPKFNFTHEHNESTTFPLAIFKGTQQLLSNIM
jgi:ribosomal protein S17E